MKKFTKIIILLITLLLFLMQIVWAAPANVNLQKIRYSQNATNVRIVLDVNELPAYDLSLSDDGLQLSMNLINTANKTSLPQMVFNDPVVNSLSITEEVPDNQHIAINLKGTVMYKVFTLKNPNRIVIDIIKGYQQRAIEEVVPGVKYTSLYAGTEDGPVTSYVVDISPGSGYTIKPFLSNDVIRGLEQVESMAVRSQSIAAVNGSYFAPNGEIIGLLKIDNQIVSTPDVLRSALGITNDGKIIIDQVGYQGSVILPNKNVVAITGVNHERGTDDLILYNEYYNSTTDTNSYGTEYTIINNKVSKITHGNPPIPSGGIVLAAHGTSEAALASLKIGDEVAITQTLGQTWDQAKHVIGAGPMLVKDGNVFLTTKVEEFGSDVAGGRAPRTAVGITADRHIILAVVDGRQRHSIGMTLLELARFMKNLGAVNALNLDGGGSSEMVVHNDVVNKPSDGCERYVGDALIVVKEP